MVVPLLQGAAQWSQRGRYAHAAYAGQVRGDVVSSRKLVSQWPYHGMPEFCSSYILHLLLLSLLVNIQKILKTSFIHPFTDASNILWTLRNAKCHAGPKKEVKINKFISSFRKLSVNALRSITHAQSIKQVRVKCWHRGVSLETTRPSKLALSGKWMVENWGSTSTLSLFIHPASISASRGISKNSLSS